MNKNTYQHFYRQTPIGRAFYLVENYKQMDKRNGFTSSADFDAQWIVNNIFSQPCVYCGETNYRKLGCNRINNSKPHTKDNIESCCWECNNKLGHETKSKKVYQYTLDNNLVNIYNSACEAAKKLGIQQSHISECCQGKKKQYKGYIWKYEG